jgi:glycosyltransferase involved in cell wall biosynthesis
MEICYVTLPNYPTAKSGRGQDRYAYELITRAHQLPRSTILTLEAYANKSNFLAKELETISRLRRVNAHVYHATSEYGLRSILITRKKHTVVTVHDLIPYLFLKHSPIIYANQLMQLSLARLADRIITHSKFYRDLLTRIYRIPPEQVAVTYYGVDHDMFRQKPGRVRDYRPKILFLGGLNQLKGVKDLVDAFVELSRSSNAQLLIGGRGKQESELKDLVAQNGIAGSTTFLGFVEEKTLPELYNSVDLVVWPSRLGFGLPMLEAMSCGTPVIAANCLDAREYLGNGGRSYEAGDISGLAESIQSIIQSEESWQGWSEKALKWSENFSWNTMVSQIGESYRAGA